MNDQNSNEETCATEQAVIAVNIAEYNATAAALAELRNKYKGVIFPVETAAGMKDALAARKELRDIRVGLEKLRKDIKEPALKRCQEIDSEAKTITKHLVELENQIDAQIKAEEARFQPGEEFAEFADEAKAAVSTVIQTLTAMHDRQAEQEAESARLEKERAELERQRAERAVHAGDPSAFDAAKPGDIINFDDSVDAGTDADDIVRELAGYTSMQFQAMAKKVKAAGFDGLYDMLVDIAEQLSSGSADDAIKAGNWMEMADADKEMALASHACVSIVCGDGEMGASVLRGIAS